MNLSLAPIQGMTTAYYRNQYNHIFGHIDCYYAPFITTTKSLKNSKKQLKDLLPENNDRKLNIVPQLLTNQGKDFLELSNHLIPMGYNEINWNIGCPYPTVTKKNRGSGLLLHKEMVQVFLDTVFPSLSCDFSVKMRLGYTHVNEGIEIMSILNHYPIKNIIIHGRTANQMYNGTVDLEGFSLLKEQSKHPIIYNGDIFTLSDYEHISKLYPDIHSFMLGRGALKDPFLAARIKGIQIAEQEKAQKLRAFHDRIYDYNVEILSGDRHLLDRMKEFWFYLSNNFENKEDFMKQLKKCNQRSAYIALVNQLFSHKL